MVSHTSGSGKNSICVVLQAKRSFSLHASCTITPHLVHARPCLTRPFRSLRQTLQYAGELNCCSRNSCMPTYTGLQKQTGKGANGHIRQHLHERKQASLTWLRRQAQKLSRRQSIQQQILCVMEHEKGTAKCLQQAQHTPERRTCTLCFGPPRPGIFGGRWRGSCGISSPAYERPIVAGCRPHRM